MAISISRAYLNGCNVEGAYDLLEQYVDTNKSKVRFYCILHVTNNYIAWSRGTAYIYDSGSRNIGTYYTQGDYTLVQHDVILSHNAEGKLENFLVNSGIDTSFVKGDSNGRITLPTIPRASSIKVSDTYVEDIATINITRSSSNFKHNLSYSFENLTGTIATNVDTSYKWTIPKSFYDKLTNKVSSTCTITCQTLNNNTIIGTSTTKFTISVNPETNKPKVSVTIVDSNSATKALTGNENTLIRYRSNAKVTITSSGVNGATIKSQSIINGNTALTNSGTINEVSSDTFKIVVTDSRGLKTEFTQTPTMIPYINKSWNATFKRTSDTGDKVSLTYNGNWYNGSFGATTNTLEGQYQYRLQGSGTWSAWKSLSPVINGNSFSQTINELSDSFPYNESFEFRLRFTDKVVATVTSETAPYKISSGIPIFDWGKNDFAFHVPVYMESGNPILDYILNDSVVTLKGKYLDANSIRYQGKALKGIKSTYNLIGGRYQIFPKRLLSEYSNGVKIKIIQKDEVSSRTAINLNVIPFATVPDSDYKLYENRVRLGTSGSYTSQSTANSINDYIVSNVDAKTGITIGYFIPGKYSYNEFEISNFWLDSNYSSSSKQMTFQVKSTTAYNINGSQLYLNFLSNVEMRTTNPVKSQVSFDYNLPLYIGTSDGSSMENSLIILEAL